jgi:uncharacterized protein (DUF2164 family)
MRSLEERNKTLMKENRNMNDTFQSTVSSLQNQLTTIVTTALEKKAELEKKLSDAEFTIQELTEKLGAFGCDDK